jgi:hypothetical protein
VASAAWAEFEAVANVLKAYGALAEAPPQLLPPPPLGFLAAAQLAEAEAAAAEAEATRAADTLFDLCDADGDGSISRPELYAALEKSPTVLDAFFPTPSSGGPRSKAAKQASAVRLARAADALAALDVDGDGEVSRGELRAAFVAAAATKAAAAKASNAAHGARAAAAAPDAAAANAVVPGKGVALSPLGALVAGLNGENELWLALVLRSECLAPLSAAELAGLIAAVVVGPRTPTTKNNRLLYLTPPVTPECDIRWSTRGPTFTRCTAPATPSSKRATS